MLSFCLLTGWPFCFPDGSLRGQPNDIWILVSAHPSQDTKGEDGVQRRSQGVERSQNRQEMRGPEAKRPTEMGIKLQSPPPPAKTVSNHVLINRRKDIKNRTPSTKCLLLDVVQKKARNLLSINGIYFVKKIELIYNPPAPKTEAAISAWLLLLSKARLRVFSRF